MLKGATARRYAEAAFELAVEQHALDRWLDDVRQIAEYFGNHQLAFILNEPNVRLDRKELIVRDLLENKVQRDALGLALLLVERGLVELAPRIRDVFQQKYYDYNNQVVALVTTAVPLDEATRANVRRDLGEITGKTVLMEERVDPSILGGAIARVGDTLIDGSVRRRLMLLRQQMLKGGGQFGGPNDGRPAPTDGGSGGGGDKPFAIGPLPEEGQIAPPDGAAAPDGAAPQGNDTNGTHPSTPSSATETAPRAGQSAHLAPRPDAKPASTGGDNMPPADRRGKRNKGRRR